jgi:hypothetical protein
MKIKSQIHKILVKINVLTKTLNFCIRIYSNHKRRGCCNEKTWKMVYIRRRNKLKEEYYCTKCYNTIEMRKIEITDIDPYEEKEVQEIRVYACICGEIYVYTF